MSDNKRLNMYPLTNPQKRIWFTENIYSNSAMWNIGGAIKIDGSLNFDLVEAAINILIKKNETFRLNFINLDGDIYQYVKEYERISVEKHIFKDSEQFYQWAENDYKKGFSIGKEGLYYFSICHVKERESYIYLKMHHIISDGWSFALIVQELSNIYNDLFQGIEVNDSVENSYLEFIKGEESYTASNRFEKDKKYWIDKYNNLPEKLYNDKVTDIKGVRKVFRLDRGVSKNIQSFTMDNNCSLNTFFITVYLLYLYKMFDQKDIVIGNPTFNRTNRKERKTAGMFTSTMPFRFMVNKDLAVNDLFNDVNNELFSCFKHQKYPYNLLIQDLKLNQLGYDSLYNASINYYNGDFSIELHDKPIEVVEFYNGYQAYPLQIVIKEWTESGEIELAFDYKVNEYSEDSITTIYEYMITIIKSVINNPNEKVENIKLISQEDLRYLEIDFNCSKSLYPENNTIIQLFEEQVERTPDNVALCFNSTMLTYRELNSKSNQLARKLKAQGVGRESKVAVMAAHSCEMVIVILAIIKAGGAYVPIDANYPIERIKYMLEDSDVSLVLTNYGEDLGFPFKGELININDENLYTGEKSNLQTDTSPKDMVYIMYTSGSTGRPKGVMIEHKGLVNYIWWARKMYIKSGGEVFALYSSLSFDLTVTSIFTPLINGNRIEIYYDDGSEFILYKILKENKVNILKLTPAHLSLIKDRDNKNSSIQRFIVGGESLKVSLADSVYESFGGNIEIFNEYGPTETVVGCMIHRFDYHNDCGRAVPIGIPADNVQIYILDNKYNIVPYGKIGELYISGDGVARGYLNQHELTKNKFIENPFIKGSIMYKTGDAAKYRKDRIIEYVGRVDNQVKIRGHRIELEEVEKQLLSIKDVVEAVVIDREDSAGDKKLYAYIVTNSEMTSEEIKRYISKLLPSYMIPAAVVFMDKIPLTSNGKVNGRLLPEPINTSCSKGEIVTPRSALELKVVDVIKEVLNVNEISINDNFYELGGDSIKAIQIATKLNNIGLTIKVKDILSSNAISEVAAALTVEERILASQEYCEGKVGNTPITSWFFEQGLKKADHWNQSVLLKLSDNITAEMLDIGIKELIHHHDSLRFNYNKSTKSLFYNNEHLHREIKITEYDLSTLSDNEQKLQIKLLGEEFKGNFDIEKDLLFKACIFHLNNKERLLLITAHHLLVDGVSWRIILEDLSNILHQLQKGEEYKLSYKTHSVREWVESLEEYSKGITKEEKQYWEQVLQNKTLVPTDFNNENKGIVNLATVEAELSIEETNKLLGQANRVYGTDANEILLISLTLAISKFMKDKRVTLELEGHGRKEISNKVDISRTVGWFTSMYPVNLIIQGESLDSKIKELKEQLRGVPQKGFNYGVLRHINKSIKDDNSNYIRFNYLGDFDSTLKDRLFNVSYENSGVEFGKENHMTCLIEVVSMIINEKLRILINYNKNSFKDETMKDLEEEFLMRLKEVLEYCCNKESKEFTPSDFDAVELSQDDLDSLFG